MSARPPLAPAALATPALPAAILALTLLVAPRAVWAIAQPPHDEATHGITCADCHVPYAGLSDPAEATGAATGGARVNLVDTSKTWSTNQWVEGVVTFTSGPNAGQFRAVTANTADTLSWERPLPAPVAAGAAYQLGRTTYADVEDRCATCHNPTGVAPGPRLASHNVGAAIVRCGKCHDPHNLEGSGVGLALIRDALRWPTARPMTTFPAAGADPWVTLGPAFNGVCETCHTQTAYHRNDASADHAHNVQQSCSACHVHERGFTVSCTDCHAIAQDNGDGVPVGGRRAVIGEFPAGDAHAHYAGALGSGDCRVCHDTSQHKSGQVVLVDPDDDAVRYTFRHWADLVADPDVSNFCAHCHDADGARRLSTPFDPFGAGQAPPDVATRFRGTLTWPEQYSDQCFGTYGSLRVVNSHHDLSAGDQAASGARIECLSCHGAHTASAAQPLGDPDVEGAPWTGTVSDQCIRCHAGGTDAVNPDLPPNVTAPDVALRPMDSCGYDIAPWYTTFTWAHSAHGLSSKRGWTGYSGAPSAVLDCTTCHDPHGSYSAQNPVGNPYMIKDEVDGTPWVDDGARPLGFNGPPWDLMGARRAVTVSVAVDANGIGTVGWGAATGLCSACHADWEQAYGWHSFCGACQTCHGHGENWGEHDWGGGGNDQPCP